MKQTHRLALIALLATTSIFAQTPKPATAPATAPAVAPVVSTAPVLVLTPAEQAQVRNQNQQIANAAARQALVKQQLADISAKLAAANKQASTLSAKLSDQNQQLTSQKTALAGKLASTHKIDLARYKLNEDTGNYVPR